jgi:hypothetical protein
MKTAAWISTMTSMGTMTGWRKRWPKDIPIESKPNHVFNFCHKSGISGHTHLVP